MTDWQCPFCDAVMADSEKVCMCGAPRGQTPERSALDLLEVQPGCRRVTVGGDVNVYEGRDIHSPVISSLKKMDIVFLGKYSTDEDGQPWIEAQTIYNARGFVQKSKSVWEPRAGFVFAVLGGGAVVVAGAGYWVIVSGVSISKLVMIALGIYGAYSAGSRIK